MTELVNIQLNMMLVAIFIGISMGITYDVLRCIRRIIIHNLFFVSLQDFIYWFMWTLIVLDSINYFNYGELRVYIFVALLLGVFFYKGTIGWVLMKIFNYIWCYVRQCIGNVKKNLKKNKKRGRI